MKRDRHLAVYVRTSTNRQELRGQVAELERWLIANGNGREVRWYRDQASGTTMARPGWLHLEAAMHEGRVERIVVWRLDRLGRTASGLCALFDELNAAGIPLVSMREGFDLRTPTGKLLATVLASVAQFETEVRRERQAAGIAAAKAAGKSWGGRAPGARYKLTDEKIRQVRAMAEQGRPVAEIARVVAVSRQTIYSCLSAKA